MAQIKVYNGTAWDNVNPKHYSGAAWVDHVTKFWNGSSWVELDSAGGGPTVSPRLDGATNSRLNAACYAGFTLQNDGDEWEYSVSGGLTSLTTWLDTGAAGDVWVMWTRTGGTLSDWNSLGSGNNNIRLNLGTTRSFRLWRSSTGTNTISGYCRFYDAASGGNLLHTSSTVTWSAEYEFSACPLCCFTPETLVTMADGLQIPIKDIRKGDKVLTVVDNDFAEVEVTEVIVMTNRPMYLIEFESGRSLRASGDHPIWVKDVGWASIDFQDVEYKDLSSPRAQLNAGDLVSTSDGTYDKIRFIATLQYPFAVYTLKETPFFANGLLVA